jgi:CRP/FNR family cyclic AMP-dependent transcriptional regulator
MANGKLRPRANGASAAIPIPSKRIPGKKTRLFDPGAFLAQAGIGRSIVELKKGQAIFSQGDPADTVFYIQRGKAKLTVVSSSGKEATIAIMDAGAFLGEDCIATSHPLRIATATAITPTVALRIDRKEMIRALHREHALSDTFVSYLLARNLRIQEDLVDQLFNSSEKRLARILLLLAQFGKDGAPEPVVPKITQEMLAEMVGTTRARVSFFMNRFRKLGFIEYNGELQIHRSLLSIVLHD